MGTTCGHNISPWTGEPALLESITRGHTEQSGLGGCMQGGSLGGQGALEHHVPGREGGREVAAVRAG